MHVLEPKELHKRQQKRAQRDQRNRKVGFLFLALLLGIVALVWQVRKPDSATNSPSQTGSTQTNAAELDSRDPKTLKQFKPDEFRDLYRTIQYPNTEPFTTPPEITGNTVADARIRKLAEARGFVLTSIPVSPIMKTNEPRLAGSEDDLLQPLAFQDWKKLKAAAQKDGVPLGLISAFRSPKWQRDLFRERLYAHGVSASQIAAGLADTAVEQTLQMTAVPGYSRHHTGYTVDLWCEDGSGSFRNSRCYQWISAQNYEKAKQYGWIPSYPEGASLQGPEPEPWEYVWVGRDVLYQ